jgi:hypothetical protein
MIDYPTYKKLHQKKHEGVFFDIRDSDSREVRDDMGPKGDEIYLFPPSVKGYNLLRKKWGRSSSRPSQHGLC